MMDHPRPRWRLALTIAALLAAAWSACAWSLAQRYYEARADALIEQAGRLAEVRANDLAASIRRNLHYIAGIPEVIAQSAEVRDALAGLARDPALAPGAGDARIPRLRADPRLRALSRSLQTAQQRLDIDILYLADAQGIVVAASDAGGPGRNVGTDVADRQYFRTAREGRNGLQYAIGKSTGVAGLFFSSPVLVQGRFAGAVVSKVHMPNLSFMLDQSDAFLSDANGVILIAHDKRLEMQALPGASVDSVDATLKQLRYSRSTFGHLSIEPWPYAGARTAVTVAGSAVPSVVAAEALPEYGLQANVNSEIPAIPPMRTDRLGLAFLLAVAGSLLIALACLAAAFTLSLGRSRARLWHKAHYDALTGLPNRELFCLRLEAALEQARRHGQCLALLMGDIDRFKDVNDSLGHDAGDRVLRRAGIQISASVRTSDTVARLGGDEFIVLLPDVGGAEQAAAIASKIVAAMAVPFSVRGAPAQGSMSLGIALFPRDGDTAEALLRRADEAMYAAKRQGGNRAAGAADIAPAPSRKPDALAGSLARHHGAAPESLAPAAVSAVD